MIKNKKTKKILSRFLAVLGVVVILVSVFAVPASAWEVTDIHFYNYFDVSAVPSTTRNDGRQAYITSVDASQGLINMSAIYTVNDYYYVPYQYSGLVLRDLLPDAVVGETYVLSGEYLDYTLSNTNGVFEMRFNLVNSVWSSQKRWNFGDALTLTEDDLNANVTIWFANFATAEERPVYGSTVSGSLRLWVNKDVAESFVPYDILGELTKTEIENAYNEGVADGENNGYANGYKEGKQDGIDIGYKDYVTDNLLISQNNMMVQAEYRSPNNESLVYGELNRRPDYPYNGYTFNTLSIPEKYILDSLGTVVGWRITLIPLQYGQYYMVGDTDLTMAGKASRVLVRVHLENDEDNVFHDKIYHFSEDVEQAQVITIDWIADFGFSENDVISSIYFHVESYLPLLETVTFEPFRFSFADQNAYDYKVGLEEGKQLGSLEGIEQGKVIGREEGLKEGEAIGYDKGYDEGLSNGNTEGYNKGYTEGLEVGEDNGYEDGYYQGRADENAQSSFSTLVSSVVDVPIRAFQSLFNFEILGVNLSDFALALITVCLIVAVVKFIL